MESSRTSLASKPQVLGLEASSPRKLPCPRLEDSTIFEQLKFRWKTPETLRKICEHFFCFPQLEHRRRQGEGGRPLLIVILPMTKMRQKSLLFLQFQFLFSIFRRRQYKLINNIEDQGRRVPLNSIFASKFKRITRKKWRIFVLKVANSGPHLAFL